MRALVLLVAALVWLAAGCATTRMTSQVNPEIAGRNYARVLVYGDFQSLEQRQLAEGKLCEQLRKWTECECVQSLDIFFPAQEYTNEQFVERIVANAVDSILTLQPTDSGTTTTYDPGTLYTHGTVHGSGNMTSYHSTTHNTGGYTVKPWANYAATLRSTSDGGVAWYATAVSSGSNYAGWRELINSAASRTVKQLLWDQVLPPLPVPKDEEKQ